MKLLDKCSGGCGKPIYSHLTGRFPMKNGKRYMTAVTNDIRWITFNCHNDKPDGSPCQSSQVLLTKLWFARFAQGFSSATVR